MSRSRLTWAVGVVAPWCLGMGLVVSFTADAGTDASMGASLAQLTSRAVPAPLDLIPAFPSDLRPSGFSRLPVDAVALATLAIGDAEDLKAVSDEEEPRADLKRNATQFPVLDSSNKGDPVVGLRPTFDTKLRHKGGLARWQASELMFNSRDYLAFEGFAPAGGEAPGPESVARFEPEDMVVGSTRPAQGGASTGSSGSAPTLRVATSAPRTRTRDGATPAVPRAVALASSTPAAVDQTPVQIVAATGTPVRVQTPQVSVAAVVRTPRPNYAALIEQDRAREEKCLAEAIYFEARSEPEEGQAAVAQVVLNRVGSGLYPTSICGVVYQNRHRYNACQFSFACEGRALRITEPEPWRMATRIARAVLEGKTYVADVGNSTHYHASYVRPYWAKALKKMDRIGTHIFYRLRPGQT